MIKKICLLIVMIALMPLSVSWAVDGVWNYNGSGNWTDNSLWLNTQIANGIDEVADFSKVDISGTRTVTLVANRTIGAVIFADSINPGNDWVLTRSGANQILTLDVTSGLPVISVLNRTTTINTWIAGTDGFEKQGAGTLVLAATNYFTGTLFLNGGQTTLDFNGGYSPTNNIVTNTVALSIGGGSTLLLQGKTFPVTNNQTFSSLTVVDGHNLINLNNGATNRINLNVGMISRQGYGFLNFNPPTNGIITTTTPNDEGMLGCYAIVRTNDWAANNGTNVIVPYTAYSTNVFFPGFNAIVAVTNVTMTNSAVNSLRFNNNPGYTLTLSYTNTISSGGIMFTTNAPLVSKITGGWLTSGTNELIIIDNRRGDRRSSSANTNLDTVIIDRGSTSIAVRVVSYSSAIGTINGSLTALWRTNNTYSGGTHLYGGGLYFQNDTALGPVPVSPRTNIIAVSGFNWLKPSTTVTIHSNRTIHINTNAYLVLDGGNSFTVNSVITGPGVLLQPPSYGGQVVRLNASNTLTGTIEINSWGLRAMDGIGLSTNANLRLASNVADSQGILETTGTFTRALGYGPNQVAWGSTVYGSLGNYRKGGFAAVGGPLTINIGGNATNIVWGSTYFNIDNHLLFGNANSTHPVTWVNPIELSAGATRYFGVRGTLILQGVISGVSPLDKFLPGTLILAATNTYSGGTVFETDDSRIIIDFDEGLGAAPLVPTNNVSFTQYGNGILQAGADLVLAPTRNISVVNNYYCTLDSSNYTMTVAGKIVGQGGFRKTGSGKVVLLGENGYWGLTTISNGDLVVNGSLLPDSSVTVTNGGFLGGTGIVGGPVTVFSGSGLVPGGVTNGGTLTINNTLAMNPGSIYNWRYDSISPGLVVVLNQVTLTSGGTYTLRIYDPNGLGEPANQSFTIMTWPDSVADPETNIAWNIEKPAGGGAEGWTMPQVTMDTVNNRIQITFQPAGFPAVDNGIGPSSIMTNTAVLNGNYTSTGATAEVYIYWGTSDGGTNKDNWANVYANGETSFGSFSNAVTNLYYGLRYYYRCYATNAVGDCWSPVTSSFTTLLSGNSSNGLRGSIFLSNLPANEASINLADAAYFMPYSRVFAGYKANSVLALAEAPQYNIVATGDLSNFSMFPGYQSADYFATVFSGQMVPRFSGIHRFRWVCDDWGMIYIDFNGDGMLQASDGLVAAPVNSATSGNITLTAGQPYNIIFLSKDNAGGEAYSFWITEPGQPEVLVGATRQPGMWRYLLDGVGLTNNLPSSIGADSATFNATVSSSGTVSEVWVYWGLADCTNVASAWANSAYIGSYTDVVTTVNYMPTGLTPDALYYVRFRITNQLMDVLSGVQVFNTTFSPSVYPYKTKIAFSGYNKDETLTNFPALVVLSESITNFYYSQFASGSSTDLRFTDESGANELSYEIEQWDPCGGLALWLKADAGVVTNNYGSVITWLDQSGQKRNVDNFAGSPGFDTNGPSGKPVVTFNGNSFLYTTYNFDSLDQYTILSVARYTGTNMYNRVIGSFTRNWLFGFHSNGDEKFYAEGWIQNTGPTNANWHIHAGTINNDPDPKASFWRDGNLLTSNNTGSHNVNYKPGRLELGGYNGANEMSKCEVAEVLIYDHILSATELNQVGYYLKQKYGLTNSYTAAAAYLPTSGQSYAWVKVPEFTNNCAIWAYWGNPNATFTNTYTTNGSMWSEGYLGVWHMKNTNVTDSTSNRYNIAGGWTFTTNAGGVIGMGQGFNGSNAFVGMGNIRVASDISVEAWAYYTNVNQNGIILGKNPFNSQWQLFAEGGSLKWRATMGDVTLAAPSGSNWHYLAGVQSGMEAGLYVDGELGSSGTIGAIANGSGNVEMGRYNSGYYFNGALDEIRLSSVMRSSNWLWASFMNQASNSIFSGFAPAMITISSSVATNITTTSAVLNATLAAPGSSGDVWVFWGMSDGGTNAAGWASSNFVGTYTDVLSTNISCTVTGLLPDTSYYFTFQATNTQDVVWVKPSRTLRTSFSPSVYPHRMKITFSGYDKDETLTNFPVLVTFSENLPGILYGQFRAGATDLRFADEAETTELNYELDTWDTNGSSYAWVQVPAFTSNCSIWAYWGYANATSAPAYTTNGATWLNEYLGVWHMKQTNALDSSGNRYNGAANGNTNVNGKIAGAQGFNGINTYIGVGTIAIPSVTNVSTEAWIYSTNFNQNGFILGKKPENTQWEVFCEGAVMRWRGGDAGANVWTPKPADGSWHHVVGMQTGTNGYLYVDGQYRINGYCVTIGNGTDVVEIARFRSSYYYNGWLDEIRLGNTTRSSNWIWASWLNQASNNFFNTYYPVAGIKNVSASGITTTSVVLNATLYASNTEFDVSVCWDTNNWGTNITFWANTNYVGSWTNVDFTNISCTVTGLVSDTRYYYKFSATNAANTLQAPDVLDFKTLFSPGLLATYPYRMQITFSGYTVTNEILTNFPALVVLSQGTNGFLYNQLQPTGTDLRFVDESTNELNYEIEQWNTNGSSYVWVQIPQLTNNCSIWTYWGNANASAPAYLTNGAAWNANFMGVWHLHANAQDSTANRYHGTVYGGLNSVPVAGLIGNAWNFDGLDNAVRVSRMIQDDFTIAFWMKAGATSAGGAQWYNGTGLIDSYYAATTNDFGVSYNNQQAAFGTGNPDNTLTSGAAYVYINDMNWRYVVATRVKSTGVKKIYVDGVDCGTQTGSVFSLDFAGTLAFGQLQTWANYFNGRLDEIEISNIDRSSNWVRACYMNQVSNSMFNPAGSVEGGFQPSINNHNGASLVMMSSANLNGYLVSTGGALTAVSVYWGTTDGGTNKETWANTNDFIVTGAGLLTTNVTGLVCAETYYYRFYASNSYGECWAPSSASFSLSRYRMKVQFGGYDKLETLTNFPALVVFADGTNGFSYGQCTTTNGSDLRFANSNETAILNHEVEKWNPNGSSYVWVQVPELESNGCVWAYWGGSDTNAPSYSTNGATWSQNYLAVWHFNSTNTSYKYPDSTSHRFDGLNLGCSSTQGQIGCAVDLGIAPKYIDIAGISSAAGSYTFHYWLNTFTTSGDARMTDISGGAGTRVITRMDTGRLRYYDTNWCNVVGGYLNNRTWRHVVYALDGRPGVTNGSIYIDGVLASNGISYVPQNLAGNAKIGNEQGNPPAAGLHFDGAMDEFQISTVPRSSNWVWACFMNQGSNSVFNTTNLAESTTLPMVNNAGGATNVTMSSACLNGYLASTGGAATVVSVCWGETDGGTNRLAWANVIDFGATDIGPLSTNVTGLSLGSTYYYRYYASNTFGESWASYSTVFSPLRYQMKIVFSGYNKPETLTNFPALVVFAEGSNGFSYSQCSSTNGGDLRFVNSDGITLLNHEIEKWDTNGSSYVWVQVPELVDVSTYIWAYWGGADTNLPAYTMNGATWNSDYKSVLHLHESTGVHYDSTSYRNTGNTNGIITRNVEGKIDGADYFYGQNGDDYVEIYNSASLENVQENNFTLEAWFKPASTPLNNSYTIVQKAGWHLGLRYANSQKFVAEHWSIGDTNYNYTSASIFDPGTFYHVVEVFDRTAGNMKLYVNGRYQGQANFTPGLVAREYGTGTWKIGYVSAGYASDGIIDEVRISGSTRSSNWVWACYMNQASNSTFMTPTLLVSNEGGATNITASSAELRGELYFDDGLTTTAWIFYGQTDGGSIATNWQFAYVYVDEGLARSLGASVGSLEADKTYYYRYYASNSVRSAWASPSASFFTGQLTIQATDANASEMGLEGGAFTVYRPASATNRALTVNYVLGGTAVNGADYQALSGNVVIPAGQSNVVITVTPIEDLLFEADETVTATLVPGDYVIGSPDNAVMTIRDVVGTSWPYKMKVTFPGYINPGAEILTNFPALVVFGTNITNFSYSTFAMPESGGDLRFANSNETVRLNYEIEQWNTGGSSHVWVQVPELVDTNTCVWAYWGSKLVTGVPAYTTNGSTWDANYKAVWHLHNTNTAGQLPDSTAYRRNGSNYGVTNTTGLIGNAGGFNPDTYVTLPSFISSSYVGNVSMWINTTRDYTDYQMLYFGGDTATGDGFGGENDFHVHLNSSEQPGIFINGGINVNSTVNCADGQWHYVTATWDINSNAVLYIDGIQAISVVHNANNFIFNVGHRLGRPMGTGSSRYYSGLMDEVRLLEAPSSSNWVWACYINQASNDVFNSYGDIRRFLKGTVIIVR